MASATHDCSIKFSSKQLDFKLLNVFDISPYVSISVCSTDREKFRHSIQKMMTSSLDACWGQWNISRVSRSCSFGVIAVEAVCSVMRT